MQKQSICSSAVIGRIRSICISAVIGGIIGGLLLFRIGGYSDHALAGGGIGLIGGIIVGVLTVTGTLHPMIAGASVGACGFTILAEGAGARGLDVPVWGAILGCCFTLFKLRIRMFFFAVFLFLPCGMSAGYFIEFLYNSFTIFYVG